MNNQNANTKALTPATQPVTTMSSLEIAELTGKKHKHVLIDIRKMLKELEVEAAELSAPFKMPSGQTAKVFKLNEELSLTLVSGYSIKMRNAIIKEWQELRVQNQQPVLPVMPDFNDRIAMAQLYIENEQEKDQLRLEVQQELDIAPQRP